MTEGAWLHRVKPLLPKNIPINILYILPNSSIYRGNEVTVLVYLLRKRKIMEIGYMERQII